VGQCGCDTEDEAETEIDCEDVARFDCRNCHEPRGNEAIGGVKSLAGGEKVGREGRAVTGFFAEVDKVVCDGDLGSYVAELSITSSQLNSLSRMRHELTTTQRRTGYTVC
jgi:hypothetical protein